MKLSGGHDAVGAVDSSSWPGLAVSVDDRHPAPVGDVSHQAESLRGRAAVQPALSQVPAGRDEENIVQAWYFSTPGSSAGSALLTGWSVSPVSPVSSLSLTLQVGRMMCLQTNCISAVLSSACSSHRQLEFP